MNWVYILSILVTTWNIPKIHSQAQKNKNGGTGQFYFGCYRLKNCWGSPLGCIQSKDCELLVTFNQIEPTKFEFELVGKTDPMRGYVAVGLSKDQRMGEDSVFACYMDDKDGQVHIHEYVNGKELFSNMEVRRKRGKEVIDLSSRLGSVRDDHIVCNFKVQNIVDLTKEIDLTFNLASDNLFLLMAKGMTDGRGMLAYHDQRIVSNTTMCLTKNENQDESSKPSWYDFCEKDRFCFELPPGCIKTKSCQILATIKQNANQNFDIGLMGIHKWSTLTGYVSLGFSSDAWMGEDSVFGCYLSEGGTKVKINEFYNKKEKRSAKVVRTSESKIIVNESKSASFENGYIMCQFTIKPIINLVNYIGKTFDLTNENVHILLARGENATSEKLGYHPDHTDRDPASNAILLTQKNFQLEEYHPDTTTETMPISTEPKETTNKFNDQYKDCGITKGCFSMPGDCIKTQNCEIFTGFHQLDGNFVFELLASHAQAVSGYVAVGISDDVSMGDDAVFGCYLTNNGVEIGEFYNSKGYSGNARVQREQGKETILPDLQIKSFQDGFIHCRFVIKPEIDLSQYLNGKIFNLSEKIHILLAKGNKAKLESLLYHQTREASPNAILLSELTNMATTQKHEIRPDIILPDEILSDENKYEIYENCGNTTGCFGLPVNCIKKKDCRIFVSFQQNHNGDFQFRLISKHTTPKGYIAVGLSDDNSMSSDSVFGCYFVENGSIAIGEYYNKPGKDGNAPVERTKNVVTGIGGSHNNGSLSCTFSIEKIIDLSHHMGSVLNLTRDKVHLLLSRGNEASSVKLGYHPTPSDRGPSSHSVLLKDKIIIAGKSPILIELHGALMIVAWILCASVGMFTARYYKNTFTNCSPKQKALWFWIHQICMLTAVVLTGIAIILIFVEINGYTVNSHQTAETYHPILGLVLLCLSFLQILIALCRPEPQSKTRIYFNWIHWTVGTWAHSIALACIYLAYDLQKTNLSSDSVYNYTLTIFIVLHLTLHLLMSVHTYTADIMLGIAKKFRALLPGPLKPSGTADEYKGSALRKIILFIEVTGALVVTLILINCICANL